MSNPGVCVEHAERRGLALQRAKQPDQDGMFYAVGEIASMKGVAVVHNGHLGRGAKSSLSAKPSRSRSIPVHATMTALSVHSRTGGATKWYSCAVAACASAERIAPLAATPPATTSTRALGLRCRIIAIACEARSASTWAT